MTITLHDVSFLLQIPVDGELLAAPAKDLQMVSKYAWGAGVLAWMYRQLGRSSRAGSTGFYGCLTLLQAWIYEYFPSLRIHRAAPQTVTQGDPLARRWEGPVHGGGPSEVPRPLDHYRRLLDGFRADHVDWLPFGAHPGRAVPRSLYRGVIRIYDVTEAYDPSRTLRQFGYRQVIPDPPIRPFRVSRPAVGTYKVVFGADLDQLWRSRGQLINLDAYSTPFDDTGSVDLEYLKWYTLRTHPCIVPPEMVSSRRWHC
ncbi:unnamed protein product [Linum tenue]|uniref:Aminotransferase-like plant mobile domain-containing protein n=3 Tax=Linum tenue TaxID=586396 RepID=A0AAV0KS65_9ROSI|nr:unnamed protein product [Linum tenue]